MIDLSRFFTYYANRQNEFQTGWQLVGQSFTIVTFETFAMVFCDKFGIYGNPALLVYFVAPIAAVVSVVFLGHKMISSGYAHKFQQANMNINQDWKKHLAESCSMLEELQKLRTELADVKAK
jgi:hypothetical protein